MKLRLKGNSLRLRLTQTEVLRLRDHGTVEESTDFGHGEVLTYRIQSLGTEPVHADFRDGSLTVVAPAEGVRVWAVADDVGLYAQLGALQIAIEKDFRCLTHRADEQEADAYPNPADSGQC